MVLVDYKFDPDRNQKIGLFFKNLASLPDTQKIASAFRFSSDLMTHESLNVKHATSPEEPTAQHLDTLIARAFNQSIAYEKHLMNDDPSVQHNLLEKTLRVITKSMFGAAQNIIAMPGNVRVLGSQLRHHPIDTTGTIAKAVCHKVGTVFYTVGSFLNALNTIKVRHDTLINKENCEFIEAFNPGWTAALEEEQKIDCRAIADTIASFSEEDMQKYIVQPFIEAHMVAGILKTAKAIHPVARKLATAAEIESDQPGGSWRTPQELGDLVRHRFATQAESEVLVPELATHVPTTARSLDNLLPSRFVPPASAQPGFLDISGKTSKIVNASLKVPLIPESLQKQYGTELSTLATQNSPQTTAYVVRSLENQAAKIAELSAHEIADKLVPTVKEIYLSPKELFELSSKFDGRIIKHELAQLEPKLAGKPLYFDYNHIFGIDIELQGKDIKLSGCHHDPKGILERSEHFSVRPFKTRELPAGIHEAEISSIAYATKPSVFFSKDFKREKVMSMIEESITKGIVEKAKDGKIAITGIVDGNIKIRSIIDPKTGRIISYPSIY